MQMNDEIRIDAPRARVYEALNDPDMLKACIPGCESLEKVSDTEMTATVMAKVGPVRARFSGQVALSDLNPPESYTITGQGKGGAAGFAKGRAHISLVEDGNGTLLKYEVHADVGGKLAQLGSRLIDSAARSYARDFFAAFKARVEAPAEAAGAAPEPAALPAPSAIPGRTALWVVVAALAVAVAVIAYLSG